jgi:hypothetical protein
LIEPLIIYRDNSLTLPQIITIKPQKKQAAEFSSSACFFFVYSFVDKDLANDPFQWMQQSLRFFENYIGSFQLCELIPNVVFQ